MVFMKQYTSPVFYYGGYNYTEEGPNSAVSDNTQRTLLHPSDHFRRSVSSFPSGTYYSSFDNLFFWTDSVEYSYPLIVLPLICIITAASGRSPEPLWVVFNASVLGSLYLPFLPVLGRKEREK